MLGWTQDLFFREKPLIIKVDKGHLISRGKRIYIKPVCISFKRLAPRKGIRGILRKMIRNDITWGWRRAQWQGALAALTEDSGFIPYTYMALYNHPYPRCKKSNTLFRLLWVPDIHIVYRNT